MLERVLGQFDSLLKDSSEDGQERVDMHAGKIDRYYQAELFDGDIEFSQYDNFTDKLKRKMVKTYSHLARYWENLGVWYKAEQYYRKVLEIDDAKEEIYRRLMYGLMKQGHKAEGLDVFLRCKKVFMEKYDSEPSESTKSLYQSLLNNEVL